MRCKMYLGVKRLFDIVASLLGMVASSPIWLIAMIGILISDPGPIFYKARRIGKDNQEFVMLKFRSMRVPRTDREKSEASFKADENRIFPFGRLCRRLKIDELPQLLNILCGSMSVVGPRPVSVDQRSVMRVGKYNVAAEVRPGLTGPAALYDYIYGDSIEDSADYERLVLPIRLELESYYPTRMSVSYDLKMIWYTIICICFSVFQKTPDRIYRELVACAQCNQEAAV